MSPKTLSSGETMHIHHGELLLAVPGSTAAGLLELVFYKTKANQSGWLCRRPVSNCPQQVGDLSWIDMDGETVLRLSSLSDINELRLYLAHDQSTPSAPHSVYLIAKDGHAQIISDTIHWEFPTSASVALLAEVKVTDSGTSRLSYQPCVVDWTDLPETPNFIHEMTGSGIVFSSINPTLDEL